MLSMILSTLTTLLFYVVVLLVLLWCWFQWTHREFLKAAAKIPCAIPALPLVGHALHTTSLEAVTRFWLKLAEEGQRQGLNTTCFWAGPLPLVLVFGMEDVQKILTSSITNEKGSEYDFFRVFVYENRSSVLNATVDEWKTTRRHLNPIFHQRNVEQLVPVFNTNCRELVADLQHHGNIADDVNIFEFLVHTALQSITNLTFGMDIHLNKETKGFKKARHGIDRIADFVGKQLIQVWPRIHCIFKFVYKEAIQEVREDFNDYIKSNKKIFYKDREPHEGETMGDNVGSDPESDHNGLESLIKAFNALQKIHPRYDDVQFHSEAITLLGTGTDTLGVSVSSCLVMLAQYQHMQERVYEEIMSVVGTDDDVTGQDINKMVYLDQVFKETLRFSMTVPFVIRKTNDVLQLSQCTLPAGSNVMVCLGPLGRDPKTFPDPDKFDPDRFAPENSNERAKYSFLPFSGGPRNCIGKRYAEILAKVMMVHILRKFHLTTNMDMHNLKRIYNIILVSTEGYKIQLHPRA